MVFSISYSVCISHSLLQLPQRFPFNTVFVYLSVFYSSHGVFHFIQCCAFLTDLQLPWCFPFHTVLCISHRLLQLPQCFAFNTMLCISHSLLQLQQCFPFHTVLISLTVFSVFTVFSISSSLEYHALLCISHCLEFFVLFDSTISIPCLQTLGK